MGQRDGKYVGFFKECAKRAGLAYPDAFARELYKAAGRDKGEESENSRHFGRVVRGEKPPTVYQLEAAAVLAGAVLERCIRLPVDDPATIKTVWEKRHLYQLLTGILDNGGDLWVNSIEGSLYATHIATGAELPLGVPAPPIGQSLKSDSAPKEHSPPGTKKSK